MAPWTTPNQWSQAKKDAHDKNGEETNKIQRKEEETKRRDRVAKELVDESKEVQSKINSTVSTNEDQSPTSKNRCSLS